MNIARKLFAVAIVAGCCASAVHAEVAAETDVFGTYVRTVVSSNTSRVLRIWTVGRVRPTHWPLNPSGDSNGDLFPYVAENPAQGRWPWVAWSRFNGTDYDLAWSRWTGRGWTPVATVETVPDGSDALAPALSFDAGGRAYAVWESHTPSGASQVRFSLFLSTRWMTSIQVSGDDENASEPAISVRDDGTVEVTYETPEGPMIRLLRIVRPWTITDDITPFGTLTVSDPRH